MDLLEFIIIWLINWEIRPGPSTWTCHISTFDFKVNTKIHAYGAICLVQYSLNMVNGSVDKGMQLRNNLFLSSHIRIDIPSFHRVMMLLLVSSLNLCFGIWRILNQQIYRICISRSVANLDSGVKSERGRCGTMIILSDWSVEFAKLRSTHCTGEEFDCLHH